MDVDVTPVLRLWMFVGTALALFGCTVQLSGEHAAVIATNVRLQKIRELGRYAFGKKIVAAELDLPPRVLNSFLLSPTSMTVEISNRTEAATMVKRVEDAYTLVSEGDFKRLSAGRRPISFGISAVLFRDDVLGREKSGISLFGGYFVWKFSETVYIETNALPAWVPGRWVRPDDQQLPDELVLLPDGAFTITEYAIDILGHRRAMSQAGRYWATTNQLVMEIVFIPPYAAGITNVWHRLFTIEQHDEPRLKLSELRGLGYSGTLSSHFVRSQ
jgi:hypothetical protein